MASKSTFTFYQHDLRTCSFSVFCYMKEKEELSDVVIRIDDRIFPAHRIILAAAIPYFHAMFTSNLEESKKKEVIINDLDPIAVESLINFAYTAEVEITTENAHSLLVVSEFLQVTQVRDSCCDFLLERLDPSNVMHVRDLGTDLNCSKLVKNTDNYIRQNFEAFCQTTDFLNLPFAFVNDLIKKDDLRVRSEEKVFDAVLNWVKVDSERHKMLPDLLGRVRMTFLSPEFLIKKASKEKMIIQSLRCRDLLDEAKHYHLLPEERSACCSLTLSERSYEPRAANGLYIFCCNNSNGLTVLKYVPDTGMCITLLTDKTRCDLQHVVSLGDQIYVFRENSFEVFHPVTLKWFSRAMLPNEQFVFKHAVACSNRIYCLGRGQAIYFDEERNQWLNNELANLHVEVDHELVSSGNNIYILGGAPPPQLRSQPIRNPQNSSRIYNPQNGLVTDVPQMHTRRYSFGCAALNNEIYVCGGFSVAGSPSTTGFGASATFGMSNPISMLSSTEIFRSGGQWSLVSSMNFARNCFSLVAYNKKLYAIGGIMPGGHNSSIECYDPETNKWSLVGGVNGQYSFVKAAVISHGMDKKGSWTAEGT